MIKKLKLRFICVAMTAVILVLGLMLSIINIINFQNVIKNADDSLLKISKMETLSKNAVVNDIPEPPQDSQEQMQFREQFFVATIDDEQNITVDTSRTIWISEEDAKKLAEKALTQVSQKGTIEDFRFLTSTDKKTIWFLDIKNEFANANNFLKNSLIVGAVGIVCVFILVIIFSRFVLKPVEESYKKQKQFITNAAHELKTPLTVISLNNELTEMKVGKNENTQNISTQVKKLKDMVQNLLTLARIDEQVLKPNKTKINLSNVCENVLNEFESVLTSNGKTFEKNIPSDFFVVCDETFLKQLLSIFLENAGKYAQTKTNFEIVKQNKKIVLTISNDTTLEDGNMEKCFERFYRTDEARASSVDGSGIGLSVAKELSSLVGAKPKAFVKDKMFVIELEFKLI